MTTASNVLSMMGNVLTLLGPLVTVYGVLVYGVLVRTSDMSPRASRKVTGRRQRRRGPVHHRADAHDTVTATDTVTARLTQRPIDLAIYQEFDALLLHAQKTDAKAEDIQHDADQFKQHVKDKWATDRANTRRQAIIAVIGAALTITGIVFRIVAAILGG